MDAATVLASGVAEVPTRSGSIPTASPPANEVPTGSDVVPNASLIFATATVVTSYTRRKGKETLIARDAEIAGIHAEEELQIMIDGLDISNEIVAKYLQEYHQFAIELPLERRIELISDLVKYQDNYAKVYKFQTQQRKPWSRKQKRDYYMEVIKTRRLYPYGLKEEAERLNRKGLSLEQESVKKLKSSEEVPEEAKSPDEVPKEKGRIVGNKMHKAFPLPVIEFPLAEEVPTASEESSHCKKKRDATAKRIALLRREFSKITREMFENEADGIEENLKDLEECEKDKANIIMGAIHDKLNDYWFNGTSEDDDDLEGILDYLEPRS
nr:hypothetical protein [Tanacetum cinerariifolium]